MKTTISAEVGGVVADALEVLGDRLQARGAEDVARVLHHVGEQLAEDLRVVGVDDLVARDAPAARARRRAATKASSASCSISCDLARHVGQVDVRLERRLVVQLEHALADVDAEVADALEVGHQLERDGDEAQVGGDRLAARQDAQAQLVDLDLQPVDLAVDCDRLLGELAVALDERADAAVDHLLDLGAHEQQLLAQPAQLAARTRGRCARAIMLASSVSAEAPGDVVLGPRVRSAS